MSWVVGVGRGYVWVNVMGKKKFSKKIKNGKSCKIHETKISTYIP